MDERSFLAHCAESFAEWILDCRTGIRATIREYGRPPPYNPNSFQAHSALIPPFSLIRYFLLSFFPLHRSFHSTHTFFFALLLFRGFYFVDDWYRLSAYFDKLKSVDGAKTDSKEAKRRSGML